MKECVDPSSGLCGSDPAGTVVRDGQLPRGGTVPCNLQRRNARRRMAPSVWGNKQVICEIGKHNEPRMKSLFLSET